MKLTNNEFVIIMAGGVGSRFWPSSREERPKQFLDITGTGETLLQQTFKRAAEVVGASQVLILSVDKYKDQILTQLDQLNENQLLLEPSRNNTAPCIAYAALHLKALHEDAVFAVIPSDHIVEKEKVFIENLRLALSFAGQNDAIVTLGITPTRADTGYGYIRYLDTKDGSGICLVEAFVEKPNRIAAEEYLKSGRYLWNAGIFIWSVNTLLSAYQQHAPDILALLTTDESKFGTPDEASYLKEVYPQTRKISVDFAIIEHATNICTIPSDIGWSDLGTWNSLYNYMDKDPANNVILCNQSVINSSENNLISVSNPQKLIVVKDLSDFIVIDSDDVLLIYPREKEQEIKQVRQSIKDERYL